MGSVSDYVNCPICGMIAHCEDFYNSNSESIDCFVCGYRAHRMKYYEVRKNYYDEGIDIDGYERKEVLGNKENIAFSGDYDNGFIAVVKTKEAFDELIKASPRAELFIAPDNSYWLVADIASFRPIIRDRFHEPNEYTKRAYQDAYDQHFVPFSEYFMEHVWDYLRKNAPRREIVFPYREKFGEEIKEEEKCNIERDIEFRFNHPAYAKLKLILSDDVLDEINNSKT